MKGRVFRYAHLGYFDFHDLFATVAELELILHDLGRPVEFGAGVPRRASGLSRSEGGRQGRGAPMNILIADAIAPRRRGRAQGRAGVSTSSSPTPTSTASISPTPKPC